VLRFKDVPPEEMSEVVRVASELHDRETDETRERNSTVAAAEEVGIPEEYLERAAAEVHKRRVAAVLKKRRKRRITVGALAAAAVIGGIGAVTYRSVKPPAAITAPVAGATLEKTTGVDATVTQQGSETTLTVKQFSRDEKGTYNANISLASPQSSLSGFRTAKFTLQGSGSLKQIRLDIQNGPTERWKGPLVRVPTEKTPISVSLRDFTYQQRESSDAPWRSTNSRSIDTVTRLGFKSGDTVNPIDATGSVTVGDIRFE
jgi:hypothetical protein